MRTNNQTTGQQIFGNQTERFAGAPLFQAFGYTSLLVESLCKPFWPVRNAIEACGMAAGARANPQGIAGHVTGNPFRMSVDAVGNVPGSGTDQTSRVRLSAG